MYPEARSVGRWLKEGWHVAVAYVLGFFFMLGVLGWHPDAPLKTVPAAVIMVPAAVAPAPTSSAAPAPAPIGAPGYQ
jgi:hypothetical protein